MQFLGLNLTLLLWILGIIFLFVLLFLWSTYNGFIRKRNQVKTDFADIDVQLKRRASLIENLVEVVKSYAKHEENTFVDVAKARATLEQPHSPKDSAKADNMLSQTLRSIFAVSESYPNLKASDNYQSLSSDIKETENLIAQYRQEYNITVMAYNTSVQTFPNVLVSKLFGFEEEELFSAPQSDREDINVKTS